MSQIANIRKKLSDVSQVTPVSIADVETLKAQFVGIPSEYVEFMSQVGYGEIGSIRIYEAPTSPDAIYPSPQSDLSEIVLFGDDFQGYCFGFDTRTGYSLIEVDPRGKVRPRSENDFVSLIASYITE